jgi:Flp pilus assembly pilin Flp
MEYILLAGFVAITVGAAKPSLATEMSTIFSKATSAIARPINHRT